MRKSIRLILTTFLVLSLLTSVVFAGTNLTTGDVAVAVPANTAPGIILTAGTSQIVNVTVLGNDGNIPANDNNSQEGWVTLPAAYTISSNGIVTPSGVTTKNFTAHDNLTQVNQTLTFPITINATSEAQAKLYEISIPVAMGRMVNLDVNFVQPKLYVTVVSPSQNNAGGFLPPLKDRVKFKVGQTIPVKFKTPAVSSTAATAPSAFVTLEYKGTAANVKMPLNLSRIKAATDNRFRYDAVNSQYIFNLNTKDLVPGDYLIKASVVNGPTYSVLVTLEGKTNNSNAANAAIKATNKK